MHFTSSETYTTNNLYFYVSDFMMDIIEKHFKKGVPYQRQGGQLHSNALSVQKKGGADPTPWIRHCNRLSV